MSRRFHLDTDFLVHALSAPRQSEFRRLESLAASDVTFEMAALAWYEFSRGPRTPNQLALARAFLGPGAVLDFTEALADRAAELYRRLRGPRRRAGDLIIAATALQRSATLLTLNVKDYADIDGLDLEPPR